jgi:hypothetical protein
MPLGISEGWSLPMKSLLLGLALLVACSGFAVAQVMQEFPTDEELLKMMKPMRCDRIPMTPPPEKPLRIKGKPAEPAKPRLETLDWLCSSTIG